MATYNIDKFTILEPRLDWVSIVGDIPDITYEDEDILHLIINKFSDWGFSQIKKRDRLVFRAEILGIEISLGKKRNSGDRFVKIEIQGKGCADSIENTEAKINEIIKKVWEFLGVETPPHATRIDLAVDILGAKLKDIFPDLSNKNYELVSNSVKSKRPTLNLSKYHRNPYDLTEQTGFTIGNSRFEICVYDRILAIKDKYLNQENGGAYCEYYLKLYEGHERVLRIETRASKELCDYFNIAFFANKNSLRDIIPQALAHFNHHHSFKDVKNDKPLVHLDRLYFSEKFKTIKTLKSELEIDYDINKLFFNLGSKNYEVRISQLARSLVRTGRTSRDDIMAVMNLLLISMEKASFSIEEELTAFNKTCAFMNFHPHEQEIRKMEFISMVRAFRNQRSGMNALQRDDEFLTDLEKELIELGVL